MSPAVTTMELWAIALGPPPDDGPLRSPLGGFYGYDVDKPDRWPPEGEGRQDVVFWFRWWQGRLSVEGMSLAGATVLRRTILRELQAGERQVVAIHPDSGREHPIPPQFWQGRGEGMRTCSWSGQWWADEDPNTPHELFMIDTDVRPSWWPGDKQPLKSWCAPNGSADPLARDRLKARGQTSPSEKAICAELSVMWREAGREGASPETIETTRTRMR